jgi:hypothetical protein
MLHQLCTHTSTVESLSTPLRSRHRLLMEITVNFVLIVRIGSVEGNSVILAWSIGKEIWKDK